MDSKGLEMGYFQLDAESAQGDGTHIRYLRASVMWPMEDQGAEGNKVWLPELGKGTLASASRGMLGAEIKVNTEQREWRRERS